MTGAKGTRPESGDVVGGYVLGEAVRVGGLEDGFLARHSLLERDALVLLPRRAELAPRFIQAARLLSRLSHPNIVAIHDAAEVEGWPYLVLEHVKGSRLEYRGPSEGEQLAVLLDVMADVAGALHHAHERGVLHRDVKPPHVLVRPSGEPVLTGFTIAAPTDGDPLGEEGRIVGTPPHMAPEQWRGQELSPATDVWGLGSTLFWLLAGERVFEVEEWDEVRRMAVDPEPVHLDREGMAVPPYVREIVGRCLRKDPGERHESAARLSEALSAAAEHVRAETDEDETRLTAAAGRRLLVTVEHREPEAPGSYREFELGRRLGAGSYGEVHRARNVLAGRDVALKMLRARWLEDPDVVARFEREAALLARLSHPNVVSVHNYGRWGRSYFVEMELLEGPDLDEVLRSEIPVDPPALVPLIAPLLDGLAAVHAAGIVHRDVKPQNVKVVGDRVVLLDFGVARSASLETLTATGHFIGTPSFAAPEQVEGDASACSDLYAVGVLLHHALSGEMPHEASTPLELLRRKLVEPPVPLAVRRPDLPEGLAALVDRLLSREPERRPTADEARSSLLSLTGS